MAQLRNLAKMRLKTFQMENLLVQRTATATMSRCPIERHFPIGKVYSYSPINSYKWWIITYIYYIILYYIILYVYIYYKLSTELLELFHPICKC